MLKPTPTIQPQRRSSSDCLNAEREDPVAGRELLVNEGRAALDEDQGLAGCAEGIAKPRGDAADDVGFGAEGVQVDGRSPVRARPTVDIRPGRLAFDAEHPAVALPEVAADLTAGDEAIDVMIGIVEDAGKREIINRRSSCPQA